MTYLEIRRRYAGWFAEKLINDPPAIQLMVNPYRYLREVCKDLVPDQISREAFFSFYDHTSTLLKYGMITLEQKRHADRQAECDLDIPDMINAEIHRREPEFYAQFDQARHA